MILLMSEYAIRPCEVRAIQFRDISLAANSVIIQRHFSSNKLIEGRKSNKKGRQSAIPFPLIEELKEWVINQAQPLDSSEFIFKSPNGNHVFENTLPKAWARTLQKLGLPHVQMYEIRHARGTEVLEMSNGNMSEVQRFLGHSNSSTTEKRYARPLVKNEKFFIKKDAEIISIKR
jgi:integrase